jgi:hypothetical protein
MTPGPDDAALKAEIARLEALADALDAGDLTPERMRDLSDEALEIAQRVSGLIAAAGDSGTADLGS